jgi:hypothetical protein
MKTLAEQIACAKRELALRRLVYRNRVAKNSMTQDEATHEIECMESIIKTLENQGVLPGFEV